MKTLTCVIAFAAMCFAADEKARRLESVSWDPVRRQFHWVISKGQVEGEHYKAGTREQYDIDMDAATMSFSEETRRFSKEEAESVRRLLDVLARYAVESTIWWEQGHGEPLTKGGVRVSLPRPPGKRRADGAVTASSAFRSAGTVKK